MSPKTWRGVILESDLEKIVEKRKKRQQGGLMSSRNGKGRPKMGWEAT